MALNNNHSLTQLDQHHELDIFIMLAHWNNNPRVDMLHHQGWGLLCLTPLSTLFHLYRSVSFIGGGNRSDRRKHRHAVSHWQTLYHIMAMLYRVHLDCEGFELATLVVIGTDCTGSCKSNYHTITTMTASLSVSSETTIRGWTWFSNRGWGGYAV